MAANRYIKGQWNTICDVCGLKKKSHELKQRWDGLRVCRQDWETRHPQELLRVKTETVTPPWVRPEAADQFVTVCTIVTSSCYADLGTADCMLASNQAFTYAYLSTF